MFLFDRQRHRRARIAAVLATAALAVVGCSQTPPQASAPAAGGGQAANSKIFMAPKFTGLAYFEVAKEGGEKAAKDLGIDCSRTTWPSTLRSPASNQAPSGNWRRRPSKPTAVQPSDITRCPGTPALRSASSRVEPLAT